MINRVSGSPKNEAGNYTLQVEEEFLGVEESPDDVLIRLAFVGWPLFPLLVLDLTVEVVERKLELFLLGWPGKGDVIKLLDLLGISSFLVLGQFLSSSGPA